MNSQHEEALHIATLECLVGGITDGFLESPYAAAGREASQAMGPPFAKRVLHAYRFHWVSGGDA